MKKVQIGVVINTSVKPSRDFLLALERAVVGRDAPNKPLSLRFLPPSGLTDRR